VIRDVFFHHAAVVALAPIALRLLRGMIPAEAKHGGKREPKADPELPEQVTNINLPKPKGGNRAETTWIPLRNARTI
jgi:hypothetical protein